MFWSFAKSPVRRKVKFSGISFQTMKMTTAQVVETSVTVNNNSPIQDYVHPDDQTQPTFETLFCHAFHMKFCRLLSSAILMRNFSISLLSPYTLKK